MNILLTLESFHRSQIQKFVANVSKLNGLKIRVIGNSFIISINTNIEADSNGNLFSGNNTF